MIPNTKDLSTLVKTMDIHPRGGRYLIVLAVIAAVCWLAWVLK